MCGIVRGSSDWENMVTIRGHCDVHGYPKLGLYEGSYGESPTNVQ